MAVPRSTDVMQSVIVVGPSGIDQKDKKDGTNAADAACSSSGAKIRSLLPSSAS